MACDGQTDRLTQGYSTYCASITSCDKIENANAVCRILAKMSRPTRNASGENGVYEQGLKKYNVVQVADFRILSL